MSQVIALADANNFYVSCHQAFEPRLQGKPVVVLSANDANVIARSREARSLSVSMGMPAFELQELITHYQLQIFSSTFPLYADMSRRVMEVLEQFTPQLEVYSIDEAFLDLASTEPDLRLQTIRQIRQRVWRWTGIPLSIGLGPTKTLAKLASKYAKQQPDGVYDLGEDALARDSWLASVPVQDVWGLGSRSVRKLHKAGIYSIRQLIQLPDRWIRQLLGLPGVRVVWELRGTPVFALHQGPPSPQSICRSRAFGRLVTTLAEVREALALYVSRAAEKLRRSGLATSALSLFLSTSPFRKQEPQYSRSSFVVLPEPTNSTALLIQLAQGALEHLFRTGYAYHRVGVHLMELVPASPIQQAFSSSASTLAKQRRLWAVIDELNARFGRDTIWLGAMGLKRSWQKQAFPSPCYTTRWPDIALVHAT